MSVTACWLFLVASVVLGSVGISLMKIAQSSCPVAGLAAMYGLLAVAYYARAKAVLRIPVGAAYAVYEAGGLLIVAVLGVVALDQPLSLTRAAALSLLLLGSYLIHQGTESGGEG